MVVTSQVTGNKAASTLTSASSKPISNQLFNCVSGIAKGLFICCGAFGELTCCRACGEFTGDNVAPIVFTVAPSLAELIGNVVVNNLIYPTPDQELHRDLKRHGTIALDPASKITSVSHPAKDKVKACFTKSGIRIHLENEGLKTSCLVYESIRGSKDYQNILVFPGNVAFQDFTYNYVLAFVEARLKQEKREINGPKLRIIILTARDFYDEAGKRCNVPFNRSGGVNLQIIYELQKQYGSIDQVFAHSLGCAVVATVWDAMGENVADLPKKWLLHAGFRRLSDVGGVYPLGRSILWPAAKAIGYDANPVDSLAKYSAQLKAQSLMDKACLIVSGLDNTDHHFPGEVSLCNCPEVKELEMNGDIHALLRLRPSQAEHHENAHHGLTLEQFDYTHIHLPEMNNFYIDPLDPLVRDNPPFIFPKETLADTFLRIGQKIQKVNFI